MIGFGVCVCVCNIKWVQNLKINYFVHNIPPLCPVMRQLNSVNTSSIYFFQTHLVLSLYIHMKSRENCFMCFKMKDFYMGEGPNWL